MFGRVLCSYDLQSPAPEKNEININITLLVSVVYMKDIKMQNTNIYLHLV